MRIVTLLSAAAVSAVACTSALAADPGIVDLPAPALEASPSSPTWSGFYLGALFGYDWGDGDVAAPGIGDVSTDGIEAGVYAGANYQLDRYVVGAEADLVASGAEGASGGFSLDQGLNGSLRARAGIALDQFLLYGTAGAAATRLEVSNAGASDERTLFGWTAGLGGEALITDSITARVEYRYTDYQDKTFTVGGGTAVDLDTHSVRAGVGVKF